MTNMEMAKKEFSRRLDNELVAAGATLEEREEITDTIVNLSEKLITNGIKGFGISAVIGALSTGICVGKISGILAGIISSLFGGIILGVLGAVIVVNLTIRKFEEKNLHKEA